MEGKELPGIAALSDKVSSPVEVPADEDEDIMPDDLGLTAFLTPDKKVLKVLESRWHRGQRGAVSLAEIMDLTGLDKQFVLAAINGINGNFNSPFSVEPAGLNKRLDKETLWVQLVARRPLGESRSPSQGLQPRAFSPLAKPGAASPRQNPGFWRGSSPVGASSDADETDSMVENSGMPGLPSKKSVRQERDYPSKSTEIQNPYAEIISDSRVPGSSPLGGINLDPALLDLQIRRDANFVPLPLPQQPIKEMRIEGFIPVIINITPVTDLPLLLGLADTGAGEDETRPDLKAREPEEMSSLN